MKSPKLLILSLAALSLASCGGSGSSGASIDATNLNSAISTYQTNGTYKLSVDSTVSSFASFEIVYTSSYVYADQDGSEWGYVEGGSGVFRISYDLDNSTLRSSELLKDASGAVYDSIYGHGLFPSLLDLKTPNFETSLQQKITDKLDRLALLQIAGFATGDYASCSDFYASITQNDPDSLSFSFVKSKQTYTITASAAGQASSSLVESYLKENKDPFTPSLVLEELRELFKDNNFNRDVIDLGDHSVSYGTEHYLPKYFYGDYNETGAANGAFSQGYLSLNHQKIKGDTSNTSYYGTYLFSIQNNAINLFTTGAYSTSPDITGEYVLNYPSNLKLWDYLEYAELDGEEGSYSLSREDLLWDFAKNNQIDDDFTSGDYSPTKLQFTISDSGNSNEKVTFEIFYNGTGGKGSCVFTFMDFGGADIALIDTFIADYVID